MGIKKQEKASVRKSKKLGLSKNTLRGERDQNAAALRVLNRLSRRSVPNHPFGVFQVTASTRTRPKFLDGGTPRVHH